MGAQIEHKVAERHIYGSSRLGMNVSEVEMIGATVPTEEFDFSVGDKQYECSNHLGNVLAVITDKKYARDDAVPDGVIDYYQPKVISAQDYSPFGVLLEERNWSSDQYRYLFQGQERDTETFKGGSYNYTYRMHHPGLGRFLSLDPLWKEFAEFSSYHSSFNSPIQNKELEGLQGSSTSQDLFVVGVKMDLLDSKKSKESQKVSWGLVLGYGWANQSGGAFSWEGGIFGEIEGFGLKSGTHPTGSLRAYLMFGLGDNSNLAGFATYGQKLELATFSPREDQVGNSFIGMGPNTEIEFGSNGLQFSFGASGRAGFGTQSSTSPTTINVNFNTVQTTRVDYRMPGLNFNVNSIIGQNPISVSSEFSVLEIGFVDRSAAFVPPAVKGQKVFQAGVELGSGSLSLFGSAGATTGKIGFGSATLPKITLSGGGTFQYSLKPPAENSGLSRGTLNNEFNVGAQF